MRSGAFADPEVQLAFASCTVFIGRNQGSAPNTGQTRDPSGDQDGAAGGPFCRLPPADADFFPLVCRFEGWEKLSV